MIGDRSASPAENRALPEEVRGRQRWQRALVIALLLLPGMVALWSGFPLCPSAGLFGLPCPGCGLTRASLTLLLGDFHGAFTLHPLVLPLGPLYIGGITALLVDFVRGPHASELPRSRSPWLTQRWVTALAIILLLLTLALWILRFAGYFGGPVAVESDQSWREQRLTR